MVFPRHAPTLLAEAAPPDPRLDEELAFIEVANALATLAKKPPRTAAPASPWVILSVPLVPCVETAPSRNANRPMVLTALVAMAAALPVAALALSFLY